MHVMEKTLSILLVLLILGRINMVQGLEEEVIKDEKIAIQRRLELINKPAINSFRMTYGDILDCVEINKQFAFDHPLLQNHKIQMKPSFNISNQTTLLPSQLLLKYMRCPRGTVLVRRIKEEDLAIERFSSLLGNTFSTTKSSKFFIPNGEFPPEHQIATLVAFTNNTGVSGYINVWNPEVLPGQITDASIFVASNDGTVSNGIQAGWMKDSGMSTGCFNALCPGFVQVSPIVPLGYILQPVSTFGGNQSFFTLTIQQDKDTKNWWLILNDKLQVGYWPKELFSTLADGATRAGWGGEIYSLSTDSTPPMGSGRFPKDGYSQACIIGKMKLVGQDVLPSRDALKIAQTKPDCYKAQYGGETDIAFDFEQRMFFGGPANCKL